MIHSKRKKKKKGINRNSETDPVNAETLQLLGKVFKLTVASMLKDLKKTLDEELKKTMRKLPQQKENNSKDREITKENQIEI